MTDIIQEIGQYSQNYRKHQLKLSQKDFCNIIGEKVVNISAFEKGRANNIKYIRYYVLVGGLDYLKGLNDLWHYGS